MVKIMRIPKLLGRFKTKVLNLIFGNGLVIGYWDLFPISVNIGAAYCLECSKLVDSRIYTPEDTT